jgi:aryl-alcohol dehydrogenase-like predicted oxidoreductase
MDTVQLGKTGEAVSQIALGCLPFGTKLDRESSFRILDTYVEHGGSFLDTANNYAFWEEGGAGGESESVLGEWFRERGNRDSIFLATKVGAFPPDRQVFVDHSDDPDVWTKYTEGLSRESIISAIEHSLRRLGTDHIDLYYAHVDARQNDLEETLGAFNELIQSGKVRHIGCSNYKTWRMVEGKSLSRAHGWAEYSAMQMFHTYLQTEKGALTGMGDQVSEELLDYVRTNRDITLLGYTPLLWGSYTRPEKYEQIDRLKSFLRPQNKVRLERLERVATETGTSANQVIYAWMMQSDPVVVPLVAATRLEHLREDLSSVDLRLSGDQLALLNESIN